MYILDDPIGLYSYVLLPRIPLSLGDTGLHAGDLARSKASVGPLMLRTGEVRTLGVISNQSIPSLGEGVHIRQVPEGQRSERK